MKDKVLKVLFIISFLPALLILIFGIRAASLGYGGSMDRISYGFEGFLGTVMLLDILFIPFIIGCPIFQIVYIKNTQTNSLQKCIIIICGILELILFLTPLWIIIVETVKKVF